MNRDALALLVILTAAIGWIALLCGLLSLAPLIPWYLKTLRRWRRGEL